ncbi:hypothetical protein A3H53_01880 [Candidatus Nomurabacteria bacterium RIFCSPLOWO2_02_FULL_40_10]|uniref:Uncharacterized protein n=1 Tax=Candidatus Nomurabacteria bacterium RIFCSPLOWO2_02_FULL_40_10 TaxID=1801786 RepID=A0A1F6XZE1_9BACT|nr:MAG: hypothetical protein A3H53_01880 [Candidatus Nomurabacteria bacterium RIFCSPLOWO2_02_FULL_40_10]
MDLEWKKIWIAVGGLFLVGMAVLIFVEVYSSIGQKAVISQVISIKQTTLEATDEICINSDEIQNYDKPVPVVWIAKLTGCLESCKGAHFTRLPKDIDYQYPRFAGYFMEGTIPDEFLAKDLTLKIYGNWIGVDADHPVTVFEDKCVPIVDIEKIEIIR